MKIYYISNSRIPTDRAHGLQIVKTCEAFANAGVDVTLVLPRRFNNIYEDIFSYYHIQKNFKVRKLPVIDIVGIELPIGFIIETFTFNISLLFYLLFLPRDSIIYVRGEVILPIAWFFPKKFILFWETHIKPKNINVYLKLLKKARSGLIVITQYYLNELINEYHQEPDRVMCAPDGVELEKFDLDITSQTAREQLGLPKDKKIIMYAGSSLDWKGLDTLRAATSFFPDNYLVVFIGNIEPDEPSSKKLYPGFQKHTEIPVWLKAADVLVLTGTAKSTISSFYTSPIKMFEYMASGKPIVALDVGSFRDVMNQKNAMIVPPDDPEQLAKGIQAVLEQPEKARSLAQEAYRNVAEQYTWKTRAKNIIDFIKKTHEQQSRA